MKAKQPGPGYYPGYSTLSQQKFWDSTTRGVVLNRVEHVPEIRFFTPEELRLMNAVCERLLPQDDRDAEHKIPIVPWIDDRLFQGRHDGYRFEDMPPDPEAYRQGLQAIAKTALDVYGQNFCDLTMHEQDLLLESLHDAEPRGAKELWEKLPVQRFWMMLVGDCATFYYAHPWAWDEIGYGGPAYPRAYTRLEDGQPEPWEKPEKRYEWSAPAESVSDKFTPVAGEEEHRGGPQQGTH